MLVTNTILDTYNPMIPFTTGSKKALNVAPEASGKLLENDP